ncbi:hypothetical protein ABZ636_36880 [Streptomyces sp. NPDC007251]|uniref:hypothetical protein n=1 Tax=Streptomyces sp. NPDC007251 TaxID=3154483 RepID=UPI0033D40039
MQLPSQACRVGDVDDRLVEPAGSFGQGGQGCEVASGHGRSHAAAQESAEDEVSGVTGGAEEEDAAGHRWGSLSWRFAAGAEASFRP